MSEGPLFGAHNSSRRQQINQQGIACQTIVRQKTSGGLAAARFA
jgi:hypothetical protein